MAKILFLKRTYLSDQDKYQKNRQVISRPDSLHFSAKKKSGTDKRITAGVKNRPPVVKDRQFLEMPCLSVLDRQHPELPGLVFKGTRLVLKRSWLKCMQIGIQSKFNDF